MKQRKVIVDYRTWGRLALATRAGMMCCLGFAAQQCGVKRLRGLGGWEISMPEDLPKGDYARFEASYPRLTQKLMDVAAYLNDSTKNAGLRMACLSKVFKKANVRLEFHNVPKAEKKECNRIWKLSKAARKKLAADAGLDTAYVY